EPGVVLPTGARQSGSSSMISARVTLTTIAVGFMRPSSGAEQREAAWPPSTLRREGDRGSHEFARLQHAQAGVGSARRGLIDRVGHVTDRFDAEVRSTRGCVDDQEV